MHSRTKKRVEQWDSRPFSDGYRGLSDLADRGFSGAISGAGAWLFMLNGRIVGIFDGDIDDFDGGSGTVYQAPHSSLPLLCAMDERGGDTRASYYTNETPLAEVDGTLQDGSFTGYIDLSENVLSGDYYAVYYGGRRMAAAYIGNAERLVTGDEAFERANEEVGIYRVIDVDIEVTDVPEPTDAEPDSTAGSSDSASVSSGDSRSAETDEPSTEETETGGDSAESSLDGLEVPGLDETDSRDRETGEITTDEPPRSLDASTEDDEETNGIAAADRTSAESTEPSDERSQPATETDEEPETGENGVDAADREQETAERGSGLAPDEVEAKAQALERSDISWTETEVESSDGASDRSESGLDTEPNSSRDDGPPSDSEPESSSETTDTEDASGSEPESDEEEAVLTERLEEEAQWRSTRSIPSIDPDNTDSVGSSDAGGATEPPGRADRSRRSSNGRSRPTHPTATSRATEPDSEGGSDTQRSDSSGRDASSSGAARTNGSHPNETGTAGIQRTETPRESQSDSEGASDPRAERIEALEQRRSELETSLDELETERDRLRAENRELSATVERYQSRIDELEAELQRIRQADGTDHSGVSDASTQLPPQQALSGTNLFVRYVSKSKPTLERAHQGNATPSDVASNLRIEHHTEFDATDVAVTGQSYEEFLTSSMEYRFVDWLTDVLLFEIRDTGHADGLADLYDALPRIDRAELHASISLEDDDTEHVPDQIEFDVVAYDKMGNPLVLVNLNDSREPATREMLEEMEAAASAVKANYPDLAAAMVVTSSYFEPGALEVTEQATSGGLLSRGSKRSFVNLSRKQGYHLCLVESRSEGFHMNVPEL
ncbi:transcriptional regulator [Natrarchaeobius halalkaliphilus]|uniref:Transcriptional regulator n=1 Tax=Natrarchaeobius halalkaliphilus TaxID=1679091 RepID=A0A3N6MBW1_9EURY|nr:transcriptional regulator [Natrarchaeobius halalkaliphilus]RQG91166.1 transcriptional regulator [Natrarchaeobius halalkaliphilus]